MTTLLPAAFAAKAAGVNQRRAAAEKGGDHSRAAADADQLHIQPFRAQIAVLFRDPWHRPSPGKTRIQETLRGRGGQAIGWQCTDKKREHRHDPHHRITFTKVSMQNHISPMLFPMPLT
jgi:hypothetical protein